MDPYKRPKGKLTNLKLTALAGVDRPCQEPALAVIMKRAVTSPTKKMLVERVVKQAVLTDEVDGHQHTIDLDDPSDSWCSSYSTSYQTSAGADCGHSHAWTFDPTSGAIAIASDSGHVHAVTGAVPADVIAAWAVKEAAEKQRRAFDAAAAVLSAETAGTVVVSVEPIAMRAAGEKPAVSKSSPTNAVPTVKSQPTEPTMDPEKQIASLRKQLTAALALSELQRGHLVKLAPADVEGYLEKPSAERETIAKSAIESDPEVYKTASGVVIRKSHGEVALLLAKQADEQATSLAKAHEALAAESLARSTVELAKRAAETMPKLAKSDAVRAAILKAVEGITDEVIRKDAIEALKAASTVVGGFEKFAGVGGGEEPAEGDPKAVFKTELKKFAAEVKKTEMAATADFIRTDRGAELYAVAYPRTQG